MKAMVCLFSFMASSTVLGCRANSTGGDGNQNQNDVPPATEDIYIAQEATGDDTGRSCDNAHSLAWFNVQTNWSTEDASDGLIGPGDAVHLCGTLQGQPGETLLTVHGSGTEGHPIQIVFEDDARLVSPWFGGQPTIGGGAIFSNQQEYIIIDGGTGGVIEATETGSIGHFTYYRTDENEFNIEGNFGVHLLHSNHVEIRNLTILNLYQAMNNENGKTTQTVGVMVDRCDHVNVHHNTITYVGNGLRIGFDENTGIEISQNVISRVGAGLFVGGITSVQGRNLLIHHNRIFDTTPWYYNDGIKIFGNPQTQDPFFGIEIYNNMIGPDISTPDHISTAWILADQGWIVAPEIHHNVLVAGTNDGNDNRALHFIEVGGNGHVTQQVLQQNASIYNNTIVSLGQSQVMAIVLTKWSTGNSVYNNLVNAVGKATALYLNDDNTTLEYCDHNGYFSQGDLAFNGLTLDDWRATTGFDVASTTDDPELLNSQNPVGDDGVMFTDDDGLIPGSNAYIGTGRDGDNIGAY